MRQGISEQSIRQALKADLGRSRHPADVVVEELNIELGASRVDVVLLSELLCAFEIKSDFDTLDRLANQMHAYQRVFDRITLVTTASFIAAAERLLPPWWGLWVAGEVNGQVSLSRFREASQNPRQEPTLIASLLWRDEALELVRYIAPDRVRPRSTREELCSVIADCGSTPDVRRWVVEGLKSRFMAPSLPAASLPAA